MYSCYREAGLVEAGSFRTKILLILIEETVNKAIIQHKRITEDQANIGIEYSKLRHEMDKIPTDSGLI